MTNRLRSNSASSMPDKKRLSLEFQDQMRIYNGVLCTRSDSDSVALSWSKKPVRIVEKVASPYVLSSFSEESLSEFLDLSESGDEEEIALQSLPILDKQEEYLCSVERYEADTIERIDSNVYFLRTRDTCEMIAVKLIRANHPETAYREFELGKLCQCKNTASYFGVFQVAPQHYILEMQWIRGCDLLALAATPFKYVKNPREEVLNLPRWLLQRLVVGIANGLGFCHFKRVAHRDIKLENILVEGDILSESTETPVKIIDFGLARHESEWGNCGIGGSPGYVAPELVRNDKKQLMLADIWSFGVTVFALATGYMLFSAGEKAYVEQILQLSQADVEVRARDYFYRNIPTVALRCAYDEFLSLIQEMIRVDPNERILPRDVAIAMQSVFKNVPALPLA